MPRPWRGLTGRNAGLVRCLSLLRTLADGRQASVGELAQRHECHRRTIYRDVRALTEAGFIVDEVVTNGGAPTGKVRLINPRDVFYLRARLREEQTANC